MHNAIHATSQVVDFIRMLMVGHNEYSDIGDAENGPKMSVDFCEDHFQVFIRNDSVIVCDDNGAFLAMFEVEPYDNGIKSNPVLVAPTVDVEYSTCDYTN